MRLSKLCVKVVPLIVLTIVAIHHEAAALPELTLPTHLVTARFIYPGAGSYWDVELSGVGSGYSVGDGTYAGWCVDQTGLLSEGSSYTVRLYSSYDPSVPTYLGGGQQGARPRNDFDLVNWIINNRQGYNREDVQEAIWYFVDGGADPSTPEARELRDAALSHEGFVRGPGQYVAVVLDPDPAYAQQTKLQHTFIEVPIPEASTLMLFGSGLCSLLWGVRRKFLR